ncbi:unnamed protein product [Ceratitis capitata]|uniref:(Mediterranean fruit fly) hypothetical protein n=1 Tax=Ceratitis capitata TaxID=7213 RepID=A0A811VC43_CERCA|nr:unnamed protein product [Ceratitis capitata]
MQRAQNDERLVQQSAQIHQQLAHTLIYCWPQWMLCLEDHSGDSQSNRHFATSQRHQVIRAMIWFERIWRAVDFVETKWSNVRTIDHSSAGTRVLLSECFAILIVRQKV